MKKRVILLFMVVLVLAMATTTLAITVEWTNITDPTSSLDRGHGIATDTQNNVYVTGYCTGCGSKGQNAIYTMKFNSAGAHQWTNINDPTFTHDYGNGIATDTQNNVYVTGSCDGCGASGGSAIYTMKFNSSGAHQWTNITDPTGTSDIGRGIATDTQDNVYVTGYCDGCGSNASYAIYTMKFNSAGAHQWINITDPSGGFDGGYGIATDTQNNVYVTGYCGGCGSGGAIYTMKFNSSGAHQWTNITDPTGSGDIGRGIATDTENNVYVTGYCDGCGSNASLAIYTMKFNSAGVHQWTDVTDPTASGDIGSGIATDTENNVYVTGDCVGCGNNASNAIYTMKLSEEEIEEIPEFTNISMIIALVIVASVFLLIIRKRKKF